MLKKSAVVAAGLMLLVALLFGRSHLTTALGVAEQSIKDMMPLEFEIKRARQMIKDLAPEIEKNMHSIAEVEVEVAKLERDVEKRELGLASDRDAILRLKDDLESGSEVFVYSGRNYSAKQVKSDLTRRFDEFKTQQATLHSKQQQLDAKQRILLAAQEKLEGMLAARRQLEVDVENLEARLTMVQVAQTHSEFTFDDSQLSKTKGLVEEISTRLEVAERLLDADVEYADRIPVEQDDEAVERDITDEISNYFGDALPQIESLVDSEL